MAQSPGQEHMWLWHQCGICVMKIEYTNRLYFGQYPYKVVLYLKHEGKFLWNRSRMLRNSSLIKGIFSWCKDTLDPQNHKIKSRVWQTEENSSPKKSGKPRTWVNWHVNIYVQDQHTIDQIVQQFGAHVDAIHKPLDDNHLQRLQVKNLVQVSNKLLFGKYKYGVYFSYDNEGIVIDWLHECYKDDPNVKIGPNSYWPRVYVCDILDLNAIQFTWHEKINYVKTILLQP